MRFIPTNSKYWQDLEHDADYWFRVWTTEEAVLKASGLGIRLSLNELEYPECIPVHRR